MTRRKKLAVAGIVVALAISTVAVVAVAVRGPSLERRLEQVREGMTLAEVVGIMGEPPAHDNLVDRMLDKVAIKAWGNRRGLATVDFDENMTVVSKRFSPIEPTGFLDRVLAWLGL